MNPFRYFRPLAVPSVSTTFTAFFHPFVEAFAVAVQKKGLDHLFSTELQSSSLASAQPFKDRYAPDPVQVTNPGLVEAVDFGTGTPYGVYNTEIFLHLPLLLQALHVQNGRRRRPPLGRARP